MSFNIGQFRRPQISSYYDEFKEHVVMSYKQTDVQFGDTNSLIFQNPCGNIQNNYVLTSQNYYYLRFKVKQREDSSQRFYLKLCNRDDGTIQEQSQEQIIDEFTVPQGVGYIYFESIVAPNTTYDQILWELRRIALDYTYIDPTEENKIGRVMQVDIESCAQIKNVIDFLKPNYTNLKSLAKIGVQGPPSLLMCINGEQIRIGKSGIYEINNGITIFFIGFIPKESIISSDELDYFIMDFEY